MLGASSYWPIQDSYHPLNNDWNGCSEIASASKNITLLFSYGQELPKNSTLAIIGPSLSFSASDAAIIRNYLERNGTVLLADDFGSGNSLLQELNVSVRFTGKPLADLYAYSKNPSFPLVSDFSPSPISDNVSVVVLNHPSFLQIGNTSQVTILASSSPFSFIDLQGSGTPAQNESINSYPVMAYTHIGPGSLVLIADSGMFINEMIGLYDNMRLFENVVSAGGGGFLVFDLEHLAGAPLTNMRLLVKNTLGRLIGFARASIYVQGLFVLLVVLVSLPIQRLRRANRRTVTITLYTALRWLKG
jgi:hypothetical protein